MSASTEHRFVEHLRELADHSRRSRAPLAALRRGLGKRPGEAPEMFPYVVPYLPSGLSPYREEAYFLIASLFAWHPRSRHGEDPRKSNLGASLRTLANEKGESITRYLVALLSAHRDDLPEHLRRAIGLLRTEDIAVDYSQLLRHIEHWNAESRWVQRDWARSYWGAVSQEDSHPTQDKGE